jgi:hypothetical protein
VCSTCAACVTGGPKWRYGSLEPRSSEVSPCIDRLLAAGSDLLIYRTSVFQILLYSVQYSFSRIPAAAAAEFHNGTQSQVRSAGSNDRVCGACVECGHARAATDRGLVAS